jgi:arsenate reductase
MNPVRILFVCIGNSCRSPMAESMARTMGGEMVDAISAGLAPAGFIAEPTLTTLEELGYPSDCLYSKGLDGVDGDDLDIIVSLLGNETSRAVPVASGARREDWSIPDPFGEDSAFYLKVARQLERRVRQLLEEEFGRELLPD